MNKSLFKDANKFTGMKDCFIHVEMKNGGKCERLVAGGYAAILHGLAGVIDRVSEITGQKPLTVLYDLEEWIGRMKEADNA